MTPRRARLALSSGFVALLTLARPASARAQEPWKWPEKMKNPKVLPPDFSATKLAAVMKGFTRTPGVRTPAREPDATTARR